jgi:hypothetical protein
MMQVCGREWFGAVRHESDVNSTWESFSTAKQRQLDRAPGSSSPLTLSPPD